MWDGCVWSHPQWIFTEYLSTCVCLSVITCRFSLLRHLTDPDKPVCLSTCLSLEVEWIPTKERTIVGTLTSFFFTFGQMILAGLAFWLRDWRKLQVAVCIPQFLFFASSWSVQTSKINVSNQSPLGLVRRFSTFCSLIG